MISVGSYWRISVFCVGVRISSQGQCRKVLRWIPTFVLVAIENMARNFVGFMIATTAFTLILFMGIR